MASNKDLLDAQKFNRLRLVTAFMSGTPEGRELEPRSHTGPLIVGVILCLVMAAGAAIAGKFFQSKLPSGWENNHVIIEKGTGARYLTIDATLRPVANMTSAQLLSESHPVPIRQLDPKALEGIQRGSEVGLAGAPDRVPSPDELKADRWVACGVGARMSVWVGQEPKGLMSRDVVLVRNNGVTYLVAEGRRHRVDKENASGVLGALGLGTAPVHDVSAGWLNLFELASDIRPWAVPEQGKALTNPPAAIKGAARGSVVIQDTQSPAHYVILDDTRRVKITPFARMLYGLTGGIDTAPIKVTNTVLRDIEEITNDSSYPTDWPENVPQTQVDNNQRPCASLEVSDDSVRSVVRAVSAKQLPPPVKPVPGAPKEPSATGAVRVSGGSGALVRASTGGTAAAIHLITDDGLRHGLGNPQDTMGRFGYTLEDVVAIPPAWVETVPAGVELSAERAWETVKRQ